MNIIKVSYIKNYILKITFENGICKEIDFEQGLMQAKNPMNAKYRKMNLFKKVKLARGGFLYWGKDHEMSIMGDYLYHNAGNINLL
jgi:hypothetical protein